MTTTIDTKKDAELDVTIELLKDAYEIIDGIPAKRVFLNSWQNPLGGLQHLTQWGPETTSYKKTAAQIDCGTLACAAGWLCLHPKFQALGLMVNRDGDPALASNPNSYGYAALARVFHITHTQAATLFGLAFSARSSAHKSIWLDRCLTLIANLQLSKSNVL